MSWEMLGRHKYKSVIALGLFLGLFIGTIFISPFYLGRNNSLFGSIPSPLESAASTNPSNPTVLYDGSYLNEYFSSSYNYYYYRTGYASSSYYYVVWLWATETGDDFDLYLYSDSSYSVQKASSSRGSGYLDWVVFRSSGQYYYPRVYRLSGSGYANIEWESAMTVSMGDSYSAYLGSSNCIETYQVHLDSNKKYEFNLEVPSGGDFDLYIYYLSSGYATGYSGYYTSSESYGSGTDETITDFEPSYSGDYAVLVVRSSGSGTFYFEVDHSHIDPAIIVVIVIIVVFVVLALAVVMYNRFQRPPRLPPGVQRPPATPGSEQLRPGEADRPAPPSIQTAPQIPPFIRCLSCGSANRSENIFCRTCGAELEVR